MFQEGGCHHAAVAVGPVNRERDRLVDPADHQRGRNPGLEVEEVQDPIVEGALVRGGSLCRAPEALSASGLFLGVEGLAKGAGLGRFGRGVPGPVSVPSARISLPAASSRGRGSSATGCGPV